MRNSLIAIFSIISFYSAFCQDMNAHPQVQSILNRVQPPDIPSRVLHVTDFGASPDGVTDCRKAFAKAINACSKKGGGTVLVSKGIYKIDGPITLKSNINLHLEEGAVLMFGTNPKDYPMVLTSWEGTNLYNYSPLIYAFEVENVKISGKGTIDGEGHGLWSTWKPLEEAGKQRSRDMNHNRVPIDERIFMDGGFLRPQLIQFVNSKRILIEDVKIEDSPFWCVHILRSQNVILRGIRYDAQNKNNDGIDIEQSRDVLIEQIEFNNADDNIAIKAGRDHDGRASSDMPSEYIVIRDCKFNGLHALVIGSEMSAGVRHVFAYNSETSGYVKRGLYLKTNSDRGGYISDIHIDTIDFGNVEDAIYMTSNYHGEGSGLYPSKISDINISSINFGKVSNTAIVIEGYPGFEVENVHITGLTIASSKNAMTLVHTKNVIFSEVVIGEKQGVPSSVH